MDLSILLKRPFISSIIKALRHGILKTLFAVFAITFGISSIVFIIAAIQGSNLQAKKIIELLGPNSIFVRSGFGGKHAIRRLTYRLTMEDFRLVSKVIGVKSSAYMMLKKVDIVAAGNSINAYAVSAMKDFLHVFEYHIAYGRPFMKKEYMYAPKVCIIGTELAEELFGSTVPVGKSIKIARTNFVIVGVFAKKGKLPSGRSLDNRALLPINTYRKFIEPEYDRFFAMKLKLDPAVAYDLIVEQVKKALAMHHDPEDFVVVTPETIRKFLNIFNLTLSVYLGLVSMAALFIAGFVMSNIFSINVRVRAWEIGIRRALGASRSDILVQFLAEATVISLIGGLLGTIAGLTGIRFLMPRLGIPVVYPGLSYAAALFFSVLTGLISAAIPASKASKWEPVRALRTRL